MVSFLKQPLILFLIKILGMFLLWELFYDLYLHPNSNIDISIVEITISNSKYVLELLGYRTFQGAVRLLGIDNTNGLWVGDPCNGLLLFALFASFIIAFPGPALKKLYYIPAGILIIYITNVLRIVSLAIIQTHVTRPVLEFHHSYTFTFLVYGLIFYLWFVWVNKFSGIIKNQ